MSVSASSASSPLSYLQSLLAQSTAVKAPSAGDTLADLLDSISGGATSPSKRATSDGTPASGGTGNGPPISPDTMAALISLQSQPAAPPPPTSTPGADLIAKIDTDGDGKISKSELENAFGPNADASKVDSLFNKLDKDGDGSVSQGELDSAAKGRGRHHHHRPAPPPDSAQGSDPLGSLLGSLQGASSDTASNADGSSTTTVTYADGSKVSLTSPAASTGTGSSADSTTSRTTSSNLIEQLIKLESQLVTPKASTTAVTA